MKSSPKTTPAAILVIPAQGGHDDINPRLSNALFFANELSNYRLRKIQARWTDTRRKEKSILIQTIKPWRSSTGPKTASGKARSAANANKGKGRDASMTRIGRALRAQSAFIRRVGRILLLRKAGFDGAEALLGHVCRTEGRAVTRVLLESLILAGVPPVTKRNNE